METQFESLINQSHDITSESCETNNNLEISIVYQF